MSNGESATAARSEMLVAQRAWRWLVGIRAWEKSCAMTPSPLAINGLSTSQAGWAQKHRHGSHPPWLFASLSSRSATSSSAEAFLRCAASRSWASSCAAQGGQGRAEAWGRQATRSSPARRTLPLHTLAQPLPPLPTCFCAASDFCCAPRPLSSRSRPLSLWRASASSSSTRLCLSAAAALSASSCNTGGARRGGFDATARHCRWLSLLNCPPIPCALCLYGCGLRGGSRVFRLAICQKNALWAAGLKNCLPVSKAAACSPPLRQPANPPQLQPGCAGAPAPPHPSPPTTTPPTPPHHLVHLRLDLGQLLVVDGVLEGAALAVVSLVLLQLRPLLLQLRQLLVQLPNLRATGQGTSGLWVSKVVVVCVWGGGGGEGWEGGGGGGGKPASSEPAGCATRPHGWHRPPRAGPGRPTRSWMCVRLDWHSSMTRNDSLRRSSYTRVPPISFRSSSRCSSCGGGGGGAGAEALCRARRRSMTELGDGGGDA